MLWFSLRYRSYGPWSGFQRRDWWTYDECAPWYCKMFLMDVSIGLHFSAYRLLLVSYSTKHCKDKSRQCMGCRCRDCSLPEGWKVLTTYQSALCTKLESLYNIFTSSERAGVGQMDCWCTQPSSSHPICLVCLRFCVSLCSVEDWLFSSSKWPSQQCSNFNPGHQLWLSSVSCHLYSQDFASLIARWGPVLQHAYSSQL